MPVGRRGGTVAIDTVPLPERKVKGVIQKAAEKYLLEVEGRKIELPAGPIMPEADLEQFVGREITAVFSSTKPEQLIAIIAPPSPQKLPFHCVLCYKPADHIMKQILPAVREAAIREMVKEKIISVALGRYLRTM